MSTFCCAACLPHRGAAPVYQPEHNLAAGRLWSILTSFSRLECPKLVDHRSPLRGTEQRHAKTSFQEHTGVSRSDGKGSRAISTASRDQAAGPGTRGPSTKGPPGRARRSHRPMDFFAWLEGAAPVILIKNDLWISTNRGATNLAVEKSCPTRSDLAQQVAEEYASDLREIINKLSKRSPSKSVKAATKLATAAR